MPEYRSLAEEEANLVLLARVRNIHQTNNETDSNSRAYIISPPPCSSHVAIRTCLFHNGDFQLIGESIELQSFVLTSSKQRPRPTGS